jgi:predicted DCC family thiol-disulfide oxidoreductase YuxK
MAEPETEAPPIRSLTVLYDADCPLCRHVRRWLERQWQLVPLEFVPAGSEQAAQRFPDLDHARTLREITVISDGGEVYEAADAWVVCLWALKGHRATAHRLSTPAGARLARSAVLAAAKWRETAKGVRTSKAGGRPTAQGTAGRPPWTTTPDQAADWIWNGRSWEPPSPDPADPWQADPWPLGQCRLDHCRAEPRDGHRTPPSG